jgi:hypothetical protein
VRNDFITTIGMLWSLSDLEALTDSVGNQSPPFPGGFLPFLCCLPSFGMNRWKVTEVYGPNRSGTLPETTYTDFCKAGRFQQKLMLVLNLYQINVGSYVFECVD